MEEKRVRRRRKREEERRKRGKQRQSRERGRIVRLGSFFFFSKFCSFFSFSKHQRTSEYLLVMHEPRASMTGIEVKFSEAMSSMPVLFLSR